MSIRTLSILSAIGLAIAMPASAAGVKVEPVKIDRDKLETPAGVEATYETLKASAESVCTTRETPINLGNFTRSRNCVSEALDKAVTDVGHPNLSAHHAANSRS